MPHQNSRIQVTFHLILQHYKRRCIVSSIPVCLYLILGKSPPLCSLRPRGPSGHIFHLGLESLFPWRGFFLSLHPTYNSFRPDRSSLSIFFICTYPIAPARRESIISVNGSIISLRQSLIWLVLRVKNDDHRCRRGILPRFPSMVQAAAPALYYYYYYVTSVSVC